MDQLSDDELLPWVQTFRSIILVDREDLTTTEWEIAERYLRSLARKSPRQEPQIADDMGIDLLLDRLEDAQTIGDKREVLSLFLVLLPRFNEQH